VKLPGTLLQALARKDERSRSTTLEQPSGPAAVGMLALSCRSDSRRTVSAARSVALPERFSFGALHTILLSIWLVERGAPGCETSGTYFCGVLARSGTIY
jgi:hypothetical protein